VSTIEPVRTKWASACVAECVAKDTRPTAYVAPTVMDAAAVCVVIAVSATGIGSICEAAADLIQDTCRRLAWSAAASRLDANVWSYADREDAVSFGVSSLFMALAQEGFDPSRGVHFTTWAYRILTRRVIDYWRAEIAVRSPLRLADAASQDEPSLPCPADSVEAMMEGEALWLAVDQLAPDQKQIVILYYDVGLNDTEIADLVGKTQNAVTNARHRGLARLRTILPAEGWSD
jgi:RNA polymerase sigma factor (sigma-70 family)